MISGVAELRMVKEICAEVSDELDRRRLEHDGRVPLG
jgi:phosphoenolpyruvate-protein kinase (PTS system EI component)